MSRLLHAWKLLNAPCREIARLGSESLDRDLGRLERLALQSHLLYCKACRRAMRQFVLIRVAMKRMSEQIEAGPGPTLPDDIRARIKRSLGEPSSSS